MIPTKTSIKQATEIYRDGFYREDQAIIFFNAYLEAVEALRDMCEEIDKVGFTVPKWAKEIIQKAPEVK